MSSLEQIEYVILSSRGDVSYAYSEEDMRDTVGTLLNAPSTRQEQQRQVVVFQGVALWEPCVYTHSHTQSFCGNLGCRTS